MLFKRQAKYLLMDESARCMVDYIQRSNNRSKEVEKRLRFSGHSKPLETVVALGRLERM
jgi:hypothetical protein